MKTTYSPRKKVAAKKLFKAYNKIMQRIAKLKRDRIIKRVVMQAYEHKKKLVFGRHGNNTMNGIPD